jgi:hypothetical protein
MKPIGVLLLAVSIGLVMWALLNPFYGDIGLWAITLSHMLALVAGTISLCSSIWCSTNGERSRDLWLCIGISALPGVHLMGEALSRRRELLEEIVMPRRTDPIKYSPELDAKLPVSFSLRSGSVWNG